MKFYEKIIGIDKSTKTDMTITFDQGFFEFNQGLKITGNTTITGTTTIIGSLSSTGNISTNNMIIRGPDTLNDLHLVGTDPNTWRWGIVGASYLWIWDFTAKKLYPVLNNGLSLGTDTKRFLNIYASDINSTTATFTTANITNADITNLTSPLNLPYRTEIEDSDGENHKVAGIDIYSTYTAPAYACRLYSQANAYAKDFKIQGGTALISDIDGTATVQFKLPFSRIPHIVATSFTDDNLAGIWVNIVSASSTGFVVKGDMYRATYFNWIAIGN